MYIFLSPLTHLTGNVYKIQRSNLEKRTQDKKKIWCFNSRVCCSVIRKSKVDKMIYMAIKIKSSGGHFTELKKTMFHGDNVLI